jgi:hypothetical protein
LIYVALFGHLKQLHPELKNFENLHTYITSYEEHLSFVNVV